ncbi:hypothetical protein [Pedobacter hiemivivus]|uniref:Uncharacterized protein n=1 Tax=Pedobacter hiemivivus TaxID=2530454 RepID=A0A4R0NEJ0_9SPHI|nr:hypothetical protein [Pedobacter hiemivivus]TCC97703.1 hypothetical protein EZ444_07240 [Pedobacter hiemivivus]
MKQYFFLIGMLSFSVSIAQTNAFPMSGNVGVGTTSPQNLLQLVGSHGATNLNMHYFNPDPTKVADLTLWASEPGWTFSGTGIGNNVYNSLVGVSRISNSKGGSYIRLLDQGMRLNIVSGDGTDISALAIDPIGNIGIGTLLPAEKLSVNGKIRAHEIKVETANWPDYVFTKSYQFPTLRETEAYIKEKGHLPGIPSAAEVKANGIDLGEMNAKLLQKIEELTLHLIALEKKNEIQQKEIDELKPIKIMASPSTGE